MSDSNQESTQEAPDFEAAQEQLAHTLDVAHSGEDKALAQRVRETGEIFAKMFNSSLRLTKLYDAQNDAFNIPMRELERVLGVLLELLGAIHLVLVGGQVYVNDIRVRFESSDETGERLSNALRPHQVGGLSIHQAPTQPQLRALVQMAGGDPPLKGHPRVNFQNFLAENSMEFIEVSPVFRYRAFGEDSAESGGGTSKDFQNVYNRSSSLVAASWKNLASKRQPNPLPMRRLVTSLIDLTRDEDDEQLLKPVTEEEAEAHVQHTLNVVTMAIQIGRELNLPNAALADLGVAGMFHDVGYTSGEAGRTVSFGAHSVQGARVLLRQRGFHEAKIRRLLVNLQHHWRYDHDPKPTLFSRIIKIADDYDTFTRNRPPEGPLMIPYDVVGRMLGGSGTQYDPTLLQLLVNRLGRYPPGSILELEDGRLGMVISGARSQETFETPICMITRHADGSHPEEAERLDLAEEGKILRVVGLGG